MTDVRSAAELVRRWGGSVSTVLFDPSVEIFGAIGVDGVIAYRTGFGCAVAIGDPIAPLEQMGRLAKAFRQHCKRRGLHTVYTVASDAFATWGVNAGYGVVEFGSELVVDPSHDPLVGPAAQALRRRVKRAQRDDVVAREYVGYDATLERSLEVAVDAWRRTRRGRQIYLMPLDLFAGRECKRWFYATRGDAIVSVMELVRLESRRGWLLSQLTWTPEAPPGTTELLAVHALQAIGQQGCTYATWGPAPLARLGAIEGLSGFSEKLGRFVYRNTTRAFHLEERNRYHRKFPVARTAGCHLLFDPPRIGVRETLQVLRAYHATAA
jgi:lysylphosphatidylglycerol synthetase-like protein (DUF2156 family)